MLNTLVQDFQNILSRSDMMDFLDIVIVAFILYTVLSLVKGTRAIQMLIGGMLVALMYVLSEFAGLEATHRLLYFILYIIPFAVVVIFQSAIRKLLASIGAAPIEYLPTSRPRNEYALMIEGVALAAKTLAENRIGALFVFEREQNLKTYIETGIALDAILSYDLIMNIFASGTPLHDGAVIVEDSRIAAASCFLPLTLNPEMSRKFGTRHRAAIGITEETDAIAVIVSEERGAISVAVDGAISENYTSESLEGKLLELLKIKKKGAGK